MPDNTGLLLLGLGALLFLGRGSRPKLEDEDNRLVTPLGGPPVPAFDIAGYIDTLFTDTATVPVQPPMQFFFPPARVVTSSGVPAVINSPPEIIGQETKVQIGGEGGETIVESSLEIKRTEEIAKQAFAHAANADRRTSPEGSQFFYAATVEANRLEEARMKKVADAVMAANIEKQRIAAAASGDRQVQETVIVPVASRPPTINFGSDDDDWTMDPFSQPGQSISVGAYERSVESRDVDFSSEGVGDQFVMSAGMDSPMVFAGEEEDTFSLTGVQDYGYGVYYGGGEDE